MKKIKTGIMLLASMLFANIMFAQSIDDGKSFMYYERYKSAKEVFQKLLDANPANEEAAYWLGQAYIAPDDRTEKDIAFAKDLYLKKLSTNTSSALLTAGVGHIELIEGKKQEARSHFEVAANMSQGKSIAVLNAIGFANSNPDSKNGDAAYAIEKLKQATEIKKFNDPDVLVNLGDAYRKNNDGGTAIRSYEAALALNPKYARAPFRIGRIYQTQGSAQEPIFMKYYNDAIALDPKYAPVYYNLFNYYYETNVNKAAEYLDKWLANSDNDPKACFYKASLKYAQGLFNDAITKADECIASEGGTPYPNLFGLKAYSYNRLKDSTNAKAMFEEYFKRQSPDKIGGGDYSTYATILLKFPGNEARAGELIMKAVELDSVVANKASFLKSIALVYDNQKNPLEAGRWYNKVLDVKKDYGKIDLYNAGYGYFRGMSYDTSIQIFNKYIAKFPDDVFGYYMVGKAQAAIDSTGAKGLAVEPYMKVVQIGEAAPDKEKVKNQLMGAYKYFTEYYYNVKKRQDSALVYIDKAIALDPSDTQLVANRELISKTDPNAPPRRQTPPRPPATPATPKKN